MAASLCRGEPEMKERLGERGVHGVLGLVTAVTYACLRVPVPLCASSDFSASSWCTAVEKRRQKLGSWTTIAAAADVRVWWVFEAVVLVGCGEPLW
jgi:hypothetical protein